MADCDFISYTSRIGVYYFYCFPLNDAYIFNFELFFYIFFIVNWYFIKPIILSDKCIILKC